MYLWIIIGNFLDVFWMKIRDMVVILMLVKIIWERRVYKVKISKNLKIVYDMYVNIYLLLYKDMINDFERNLKEIRKKIKEVFVKKLFKWIEE